MEDTHPGITPMNSQCYISGVKQCESLMHRIRTIQGRTNLNLAEPHFASNDDEKQSRSPAGVDFKKRIKHQQEILERCKRKVADQLDRLYRTRKSLKTKRGDCNETGDNIDVSQLKISQLFPECKSKKRHKRAEASTVKKGRKINDEAKPKAKQEEDVALEQSQAVTSLKLVQKAAANTEGVEEPIKTRTKRRKRRVCTFNLEQPEEANKKEIEPETKPPKLPEMVSPIELSKESRLKNIVNSAIARLNKAKSSVQKVMKDDNAQTPNSNDLQVTARPKRKKSRRQELPVEEAQKPLHGILKGSSISCMSNKQTEQPAVSQEQETVTNSVMKEINSAKIIARAQSARVTRNPQRLWKKQNKSTGCLLTLQKKSLHELGKAPDVKVQAEVQDCKAVKVPSGKDVCKKVTQNTNKTLSNLNEQMSNTLQESIAHLNELCLRVRNCLTDIEADELNYQKQKSKQKQMQFDKPPPSECVECEVDDDNIIHEEEPPTYQVEELQCIPHSNQSFKITKEPPVLTTIEQVITAISLGNGEIQMDMPSRVVEAPPAPPNPQPEDEVSPKRKKSSSSKKKRRAKKSGRSLTKLPSIHSRVSSSKLPIWQRQLPSIIEEIQQTVKKQATRTQYRDFLKNLKQLVGSDRCVLPQKYILPQQMPPSPSSPPRGERMQARAPKQVYQRLKDVKNVIEVTGLSDVKKSKPCTQCALNKCTCGVKVENLCPTCDSLSSRQKLQWIRTRSDMGSNSFQTYDILDEISPKDVEPIQSEYPRKDHLPSAANLKKVEDTLLYQLVYNRNPKLLENFLQSTSFVVDALKQEKKGTEKSTSERHVTLNKVEQKLRPKSASNAYRLYEKFEFDRELPPHPERPISRDLIKEIQVVKAPKSRPKSSAKKIDDTYSTQSVKSKSAKPRPEKSARSSNKSSSAKSASKKGKKDQIRAKLKPLLQDPNFQMKKILTIMPTFIDQREQMSLTAKEAIKAKLRPYIENPDKMFTVYPIHVKYHSQGALESTAKRDVIQKLKPYIFMNFSSANLPRSESNPEKIFAVYPVQVRYQYQKIDGKQKTVKVSRATSEVELDASHVGASETMAAKKDVVFEESHSGALQSTTMVSEPSAKRGVSLESMAAAKKDVVFEVSHKGAALESEGALQSMTKRDVIKKLKPYIFMNLRPTEVTVMPVSARYNAKPTESRAGHRASENPASRPSTSKKTPWFPKDHGDDCYTGKKPCKKCQLQIGAEQVKYAQDFTVMTHMEPNYLPSRLGDRRQYWSNNRKATGEHMVSVVVKNPQEAKPTKAKQPNVRNTKPEAAANKELYKNAANTRNKLKEVKKMVKKNDLISHDLQDIIDTIEFKIVDVLSNQKKDCSGALRNIEDDIKCVLEMVNPKPPLKSPPSSKGRSSKLPTPKTEKTSPVREETPVKDSLTTKIDNALLNLEQRKPKNDSADDKMICIYAKGPPDNSLQIVAKNEPETTKAEIEMVDSEQEDAELRNIDENIEKVISELNSLVNPSNLEAKDLTENLEKPALDVASEDVPTKDVEGLSMSFTDSQGDLKSADSPEEAPLVISCENMVNNFCKQVDTVIKKITSEESLAEKRDGEDEIVTVQSTDEYLTPYMRAIKDYRRSPNQTQSFMDFLNQLSRLSQEETAVHYNYKHTMNRASIENVPENKEVIQRRLKLLILSPPSDEKKPARKKTKNRRLQTALSSDFKEHELETPNKNKDVQTEGEYIEEEDDDCFQPPKYAETIRIQTSEVTNRGTQHESNPFQSESFTWSLLSEPSADANLAEIPEEVGLVETATEIDLLENTKNKDTQIPSGENHRCFASIENQITQVTDDLKRLCTNTIESQVSELHFKSLSHSVSVGTEPKPCSLDKTCSNLSTVTSNGSFDQIKDFICVKSQSKLSGSCQQKECKKVQADFSSSTVGDPKNKEVVSIFECRSSVSSATKVIDYLESKQDAICNDRVSFGINTSEVLMGDAKLYGRLDELCPVKTETDLEMADAHKRFLGSVYGLVFTVVFLGLNLQYSC